MHLGIDENPIVIAHWRASEHHTGTRTKVERPWCAPKGTKRARIEELQKQHENELIRMESARAAVIMLARSFAERARKSKDAALTNVVVVVAAAASSAAPTANAGCTIP